MRSIIVRRTSSHASFFAASSPPKPAPTMITCGCFGAGDCIRQIVRRLTRRRQRARRSGYPPAPFCEPESIRGWYRRTIIKRLSLRLAELTFAAYAEAHCPQQNAQISGETLQDYCPWKGFEGASLATPSIVDEKRKAQTPAGQSSARRRHRCGASKGESSFRLTGLQLSNESPAPRSLPLRFVSGLSSCLWS